jgi:uncharacterized oxidoreductase
MKTSGNTILITGGATGIGLAVAKAFVKAGNTVIICGRRRHKLDEAKQQVPALHTLVCDIASEHERQRLFKQVTARFPTLNILVNNAGVQRMIDLRNGVPVPSGEDEIEINLKAPIDLAARFIPFLAQQERAAIVNVSSGLAFVPLAMAPVYCATKAALHSFTISLRHQLRDTGIRVFELIPPRVDTELGAASRGAAASAVGSSPGAAGTSAGAAGASVGAVGTSAGAHGAASAGTAATSSGIAGASSGVPRGIPAADVAEALLSAMENDEYEFAVGLAEGLRTGARSEPEAAFQRMNR